MKNIYVHTILINFIEFKWMEISRRLENYQLCNHSSQMIIRLLLLFQKKRKCSSRIKIKQKLMRFQEEYVDATKLQSSIIILLKLCLRKILINWFICLIISEIYSRNKFNIELGNTYKNIWTVQQIQYKPLYRNLLSLRKI